ncbi:MAG: IS3 family transposase, partial [Comamonas sp.]
MKLYIKLGKRVAVTIQQLGYPRKNLLKGWHREYEQDRYSQTAVVRPPKFTAEQKSQAFE